MSSEEIIDKDNERAQRLMDFYKNKSKKLKQVQFSVVNISKVLEPEKEFFLFGEMVVENFLDRREENQLAKASNWQCWKKASIVNYRKDIQCLEIQSDKLHRGERKFDHVILMLDKQGNKDLHQLANLLRMYKGFISEVEKAIAASKHIFLKYPKASTQINELFLLWMKDCYSFLKENTNPKELFTYEVAKIDPICFDHTEYCFGMSRKLLALLGINEEEGENIALRYGKIEFFCEETRLFNLQHKLMFALQLSREKSRIVSYNITTIDGMQVPVTASIFSPKIPLPHVQKIDSHLSQFDS